MRAFSSGRSCTAGHTSRSAWTGAASGCGRCRADPQAARRLREVHVSAQMATQPQQQQQQPSSSNGAGAADASASTRFLRPHLLKLAAYTPIEPFEILSARYGRKPEEIIKLDANENPYGPPPEVRQALAQMPFPHVYPDPESRRLRAALAKAHNIPIEHLLVRAAAKQQTGAALASTGQGATVGPPAPRHQLAHVLCIPGQVGCGADELIDLLMRCVLDPGDKIVDCPPTFTMCVRRGSEPP